MADNGADFMRSMSIATSGLRAQAGRMRVISENIANADSTAQGPGGEPYRRKVPTFSSALDRALDAKVVTLGRVRPDMSTFRVKHEPGNPAAEANLNIISATAPDDPAHTRYPQVLIGESGHGVAHSCSEKARVASAATSPLSISSPGENIL